MYVKIIHHLDACGVSDKQGNTKCKVVPYTTDLIEIPSEKDGSTRIKYNKVRVKTADLVRGFSEDPVKDGESQRLVRHKLPEGVILGDCPSKVPFVVTSSGSSENVKLDVHEPETEYIELWIKTGDHTWEAYSIFACDMFVMNNEGRTLDIVRCPNN